MAVRRPRIKAIANIGVKRKIKEDSGEPIINCKKEIALKNIKEENESLVKKINNDKHDRIDNKIVEKNQNFIETESIQTDELITEAVDVNSSPTKKNQLLNDVKKSTDITKPRQRIKATPVIESIRRNSINSVNYLSSDIDMTPSTETQESPFKDPPAKIKNSNINRIGFGSVSQIFSSYHSSIKYLQQPPPSPHSKELNLQPSRDHIPARQRKFSQMDDINRLSVARKEFHSKYSDKQPEKSNLKMFDFIYYNPSTNPIKIDKGKLENPTSRNSSRAVTPTPIPPSLEETPQEELPAAPVPQLKLGPNGELVLDEKSLIIETTAAQQARQKLASKDCIYLDEYSGNNGFYSRQKRTKDWNSDETIKFYRCLHTVGTDFSLMLTLFPNRSRRDLKLKFKKEERYNGHLINKAILQPKVFDIEELKNEFKREELAQLERERQFKELEAHNSKNKRDILKIHKTKYKSKADQAIKNGDIAYQMENTTVLSKRRLKSKNKKKDINSKIEKQLDRNIEIVNKNRVSANLKPITKNESPSLIKHDIEEYDDKCFQSYMDTLCDDNEITLTNTESSQFASDLNVESPLEVILDTTRVKNKNNNDSNILEITDISNIFSIADIMPQLADIGSLALVTSKDNNRPNKVKYEIYILCKPTDTLSKKPLDLPEETINCIITAIGKYQNSTSDNEI